MVISCRENVGFVKAPAAMDNVGIKINHLIQRAWTHANSEYRSVRLVLGQCLALRRQLENVIAIATVIHRQLRIACLLNCRELLQRWGSISLIQTLTKTAASCPKVAASAFA